MNETNSISVQSFEHFKELIFLKTQNSQTLFRGQNKDYDLKPGIARQKNRKNLLNSEKLIFDNFKRRVQIISNL